MQMNKIIQYFRRPDAILLIDDHTRGQEVPRSNRVAPTRDMDRKREHPFWWVLFLIGFDGDMEYYVVDTSYCPGGR